jgi:CubicO group peptidase (beta-lactamase class C family)
VCDSERHQNTVTSASSSAQIRLTSGRRAVRRGDLARAAAGHGSSRRPQAAVGLDVVEELAERAMRSRRRIGLVIGCLAGGEQGVVGHGHVRSDATEPPDGGTIFEIGSVTKVYTGLLLADLAEHDLVGLGDPLGSYLPASVQVPTFGDRQITLGDLASHTSGLRRTPGACCAGGWATGTTPTRTSRSRSCTPAWLGPSCGAGRASVSSTPTWAPAC